MKRAALAALFAVAFLIGIGVGTARAEERIISFHADIRVQKDGSLIVSETITVVSEGRRIRRGIFRDFPTIYRNRDGSRTRVGFELLGAFRDGQPEEVSIKKRLNGLRIKLGRASHLISRGEHYYVIRYRTTRQLLFGPENDELYWNVTGNGWEFPIEEATALVVPPGNAIANNAIAYTGLQRETGTDFELYYTEDNDPAFRVTRRLGRGEGLTVVVSWPKGFVDRPTVFAKIGYFFSDNADLAISWIGLFLLAAYYYLTWQRVGRDPEKGVIVPHYVPPRGVSPAEAAYLSAMGYRDRAFTAAIVNMAVKGYHSISKNGSDYVLERAKVRAVERLSQGEKAIGVNLFLDGDYLPVDNENHERFEAAREAHKRALSREHEHIHFVRNARYFYVGLMIAFVSLLGAALTMTGYSFWLIPPALMILALIPTFYFLLKRPTLKGRRLMDELEGFKDYLSVAEKDRLKFHNPPEKTPELFEKYLPYAIALKVEDMWGSQFEDVLAKAARAAGRDGYSPAWYSGGGRRFRTSSFTRSMSSGFTSAISSASTAPSSGGSGFSGGFSGGGGGGGGGGGW